MAKGQSAEQKQRIVEILKQNRGAAMALSEIAMRVKLAPQQVLTLLGQLKGEVECASRATMESTVSMKWEDVDSKWRFAGAGAAKAPTKWPPRPGSVPFGSETAAQLEERLKKGKLPRDRVVLAAWLGHAAAREVLGDKAPAEENDLRAWLSGLGRFNQTVRVRGLAAGARRALAAFDAARPGDERPRQAVEAALAFGKSGTSEHARLAVGTALPAEDAVAETPEGPARAAAKAASRLGILVSAIEARRAASDLEAIVGEIAQALGEAAPPADVRAAVRDELGPWALA